MKKLHQNVMIDGKYLPEEYKNRRDSNFFNEGKWQNFIEPLLPTDRLEDRTFVEIGCNAGIYLRMAKEYGFRNVWGVEKDIDTVVAAQQYREFLGMDYHLLHRDVGLSFSWNELPVADVVLLANVHYYIHMSDFMPFIDRMRFKTIYCIVVSRQMRDKKHGYPMPEIEPIRAMFKDWELERILTTSSNMLDGDPHPRRMHSLLFKSDLRRQPISDYTTRTQKYIKQQEYIDMVNAGQPLTFEGTENWRYWKKRKQEDKSPNSKYRWTDEQIKQHLKRRYDLVKSLMERGMREPTLAFPDRANIDGGNRAQILKLLGYGSLIVRLV
jgi:hypothetical protein